MFAKDGEIFDLNGKQTVVMGGTYSIDKEIRLAYGWGWWEDEQPLEEIKRYVEQQLENYRNDLKEKLGETTSVDVSFVLLRKQIRIIMQDKLLNTRSNIIIM